MVDILANVTEASWDAGKPGELDYLKPNGFKFLVTIFLMSHSSVSLQTYQMFHWVHLKLRHLS